MNTNAFRAIVALSLALLTATVNAEAERASSGVSGATTMVPARAYLIANYVIRDQAMFQSYLAAANKLAPMYSAKVIVFDMNTRLLEGTSRAVTVIAEFPNRAEAERFYFSADYTETKKLRIGSTEGSVVLTEGLLPGGQ